MSSVVRFRFRPDINFEAQQVLARLFAHLAQSMEGVTNCWVHFEEMGGEWVAHMGGSGAPFSIGEQQPRSVASLSEARQRRNRT